MEKIPLHYVVFIALLTYMFSVYNVFWDIKKVSCLGLLAFFTSGLAVIAMMIVVTMKILVG
ncbi:MAG: hypothetical protein WHV44_08560 [Anaerolineales bacterium]